MPQPNELTRFEEILLPHLPAAYNLARWLLHNGDESEDMVQEAYLRAFRSFDGFRGGDARAWLLTIVRNTCYTWLRQNRIKEFSEVFNEEIHTVENAACNPEALLLENANGPLLKDALEDLPPEFREVIVLREMEGMSYKEIADVVGIPMGTVMSRLARARAGLQRRLTCPARKEI